MATAEEIYAAFTALAREYCTAVEDEANHTADGLVLLQDILLRLYSAAIKLPVVKLTRKASADGPSQRLVAHDDWHALYGALQDRLPFDPYHDTFDPLEEPPDLLVSSLADDLADVWSDLKGGLLRLDEGIVAPAAVWSKWKFFSGIIGERMPWEPCARSTISGRVKTTEGGTALVAMA